MNKIKCAIKECENTSEPFPRKYCLQHKHGKQVKQKCNMKDCEKNAYGYLRYCLQHKHGKQVKVCKKDYCNNPTYNSSIYCGFHRRRKGNEYSSLFY